MIALAGMRRRLHIAQERIHFLNTQTATGAHGSMAGQSAANLFQPFFQRQPFAKLRHFFGHIAHQLAIISALQHGWHFAQQQAGLSRRTGAETLQHKAHFR